MYVAGHTSGTRMLKACQYYNLYSAKIHILLIDQTGMGWEDGELKKDHQTTVCEFMH